MELTGEERQGKKKTFASNQQPGKKKEGSQKGVTARCQRKEG